MTLPHTQIPWETRLGIIGESAIKSRLGYFSNPTKYEADAGIDFYCELIKNDSPSIPFYVQAKGVGHFDKNWGRSIPKSTITYWLQQPHPVFLIIYDDETKICYWMSIEDYRYDLIQKLFTTDSKTIYIKVDRSNILEQARDRNGEFIKKIKGDVISIQLFRGRPLPIGEGYVKKLPPRPRSEDELHGIRENIRASLYSLLQHYLDQNDLQTVYAYCQFLAEFDTSHYTHFELYGQIAIEFGEIDIAKKAFEQALKICKADQNWPRRDMERIIRRIQKRLQDLQDV